jgi:hypothetical protein
VLRSIHGMSGTCIESHQSRSDDRASIRIK